MKKNNLKSAKQFISLALLVCLILPFFYGCSSPNSQRTSELWLVTEQSTWDRMNGQLYVLQEAYEKEHSDVKIRVDYLPTNQQERDVYLQQLRTEILQGGGPDCYLLPTDNTLILDEPKQYTYVEVEPLFADVEHAMRNGLFYDITALYDADNEIGKEGLNAQIMDAGVVDGVRYVLPLRYDMPVIFAENEVLEAAGLDPAILTQDLVSIMKAVYETGNPLLAGGLLYSDFSIFSDFVDYQSGNAVLDAKTLSPYIAYYQKLKSLLGEEYLDYGWDGKGNQSEIFLKKEKIHLENLDLKKYIYDEYADPENMLAYYPLWIGTMQDVFDYVPLSKFEESDLTVAPLQSVGANGVVATVSYYAAVGSGCDNPELAYDFLRQFLSEDSQWDLNRPERNHTKPLKGMGSNTSNDLQYPGLVENGWPVRDKDALQDLWNSRRRQIYVRVMDYFTPEIQKQRMHDLGFMGELEEERVPLFGIAIAQVRFNTSLSDELETTLEQLNDSGKGYAPTEADIEKIAQRLIWSLRWHASEG